MKSASGVSTLMAQAPGGDAAMWLPRCPPSPLAFWRAERLGVIVATNDAQ